MNIPVVSIIDAPLRQTRNTVGFWREDFTVRSLSLEPQWREERGVALQEGADSALRWLQLVHPEDRLGVTNAQQAMLAARQPELDIEYRVKARERGWFWVAQRGQIVDRASDGQPRSAAGVIVDIDDAVRQRQLEQDLLDVVDRERQRVGSDLHDGVGQELTAVSLMLQSCLRELRAGDMPQADAVGDLVAQLNRTIENTRALAHGLSPLALESEDLACALRSLVTRCNGHAGLRFRFFDRLARPLCLPSASALHLLRIAQEAVNNAVKHSAATDAVLEIGEAAGEIYLSVRDNGRGFPETGAVFGGMGMRMMQYRARQLTAELQVYSAPGQGVTVSCRCQVHSNLSPGGLDE